MSSSEATAKELMIEFIRQSSLRDSKVQSALKKLGALTLEPTDDIVPAPKPSASVDTDDDDVDCDCVSRYTVLSNLTKFTGFEPQSEARSWLASVDLQREKHNWTEAFTLEVARSLLIQDAAAWAEIDKAKLINWCRFKIEFGIEYCDRAQFPDNKPLVSVECMARNITRWEDSLRESREANINRVGVTIDAFTDRYYQVRRDREDRRNEKNEQKRLKRERQLARQEAEAKAKIAKENKAKIDKKEEKTNENPVITNASLD